MIHAFLLATMISAAPDPAAYESMLIPLIFEGRGAFGSQWITDISLLNTGEDRITPYSAPFTTIFCIAAPCVQSIGSGETITRRSFNPYPNGFVLRVPRQEAAALRFNLAIRDISRESENRGTQIPVVRERDLFASSFTLLDLPNDDRYRTTLRLYATDIDHRRKVTLVFYALDSETPAAPFFQPAVTLDLPQCTSSPCSEPASVMIDLATYKELGGKGRLRVDVVPEEKDGPAMYWGFATLTNNATQLVTVVSPQ